MKYNESQALAKIASYCSQAERAEYDVIKKLQNWELETELIKKIIDRLKNENFLNEERYCRAFIMDKTKFNKWGKLKIYFELKKKRISESSIQQYLTETDPFDFEESLFHILQTKMRTVKAKDDYEKQNKLIRFGLGRGYNLDQIKKCLKKLQINSDEKDSETFY